MTSAHDASAGPQTTATASRPGARLRREPPGFRQLTLRRTVDLSPHLRRVTLGGDALEGFSLDAPAASVRLLLPRPGDDSLTLPTWNGNEFLDADGERPIIRTYTPRSLRADALELDLDVVLHDGGAVPAWLGDAQPGAPVAISGPGRGYDIDPDVDALLLAGDESAIPAVSQLLEHLPATTSVIVLLEVARPDARHALPEHPSVDVRWLDLPSRSAPGTALVGAVEQHTHADAQVWAAGEAVAMQRIRRHLFEVVGLPRSQATVRGYWKAGRSGDAGD